MKYYVIEHQIKPDGNVNVSETERQSFASGNSLYHERISKMLMNTEFVSVHIMLVDATLNILENKGVVTSYVAPDAE